MLDRQLCELLGRVVRKVETKDGKEHSFETISKRSYVEISDATSYKSTPRSVSVLARASIFCWKRYGPSLSRKNMQTLGGESLGQRIIIERAAGWLLIQTNFGT